VEIRLSTVIVINNGCAAARSDLQSSCRATRPPAGSYSSAAPWPEGFAEVADGEKSKDRSVLPDRPARVARATSAEGCPLAARSDPSARVTQRSNDGSAFSHNRGISADIFGTAKSASRCNAMRRFFFDLAGDLSAHDFMGHDCASKKEAKQHACFIAHRIGTERPSFAKPGNYISVRDDRGAEIFKAPIRSSLGADLGRSSGKPH